MANNRLRAYALKIKKAGCKSRLFLFYLEAPTRFELVMEVLQTSALPLGDGAHEFFVTPKKPGIDTKSLFGCQGQNSLHCLIDRPSSAKIRFAQQPAVLVAVVGFSVVKIAQQLVHGAGQGSIEFVA